MTKKFTKILSKNHIAPSLTCFLMLGLLSTAARAQLDEVPRGYLVDSQGTAVRSGTGLCWHTGTGPSAARSECEPAVTPVAKADTPAPPPAPAVAVAAIPPPIAAPVSQKVTLDADALFDFDKATLRPAGINSLDGFLTQIKDIDPEIITAVGHADRFGTESYNQTLSEKRVDTVRAYLQSKGIAANRLQTEGKGEMQPVTKAGDCEGKKSAQVIACLQPDRRVEVEVVGIRIAK